VVPPRHHYALRERFPIEWRNLRELARVADDKKASAIIASSATSATLTAARMHARVGTRRPFGIVFHSLLDQFVRSRRGRALLRWGNSADIRLVVLSQRLRNDVVAIIPGLAQTLHGITHPYLFTDAPVTPSALDPARITFAFIGNATLSKGFDDFVSLMEQTTSNARFELIGHLREDCPSLLPRLKAQMAKGRFVSTAANERLLTAEYRARLATISYAVFPYRRLDYQFVASGAALDALWAAKPLIALRIPVFEELFNRLGDIGYLCEDLDELRATVEDLSNHPKPDRYRAQSDALIRGRRVFEPEAVGDELRAVIGLAPNRAPRDRAHVVS